MEKQRQITTVNPATGQRLADYPVHGPGEIASLLRGAQDAFRHWRRTDPAMRTAGLQRLAELLRRDKTSLADLAAKEMGKQADEAEAEVEKCAACASFYAEQGAGFLEPQIVVTEARRSFVSFEPLGPVLAIMPWNFPFWQAVRCLAPALMAGNVVVLKHASNVTGCALALGKLVREAFGRDGLLSVVLVPGSETLPLIARAEIAAVSLTGSTEVGREVAAAAGRALKKCVLELGGSDAYVVLADADIALAAKICAQSRLINAGQSCISAKRFVVEKPVLAAFTEAFVRELQAPALAPLAREDLRKQLQEQVDRAVAGDARLLCGGKIPAGAGYHYPATALTAVGPENVAAVEELFGPVAAILEARDEAHALALANSTSFGLGAAVFTRDPARAERICRYDLEAGSCFANALVKSDSRLPFGGIKESGYGRELGVFGIREFTNAKTVYLA